MEGSLSPCIAPINNGFRVEVVAGVEGWRETCEADFDFGPRATALDVAITITSPEFTKSTRDQNPIADSWSYSFAFPETNTGSSSGSGAVNLTHTQRSTEKRSIRAGSRSVSGDGPNLTAFGVLSAQNVGDAFLDTQVVAEITAAEFRRDTTKAESGDRVWRRPCRLIRSDITVPQGRLDGEAADIACGTPKHPLIAAKVGTQDSYMHPTVPSSPSPLWVPLLHSAPT